MEKALATFHNGQVEFDRPIDWPEGTRLEVIPATKSLGLNESDWPSTPEQIAEWLTCLKNLEPLDMTPAEIDAFEMELKATKEAQKELMPVSQPDD